MDLKSLFHLGGDKDDKKKNENKENEPAEKESKDDKEFVGSGIFTADGKELPAIEGGYDLVDPDSGFGDNDFS